MQLFGKHNSRAPLCLSWDIVLFFSLYAVSPAYLGLELSAGLPVLTLSRLTLVLMAALLFWRRRKDLVLKNVNFGLTNEPVLRWGLIAFFALLSACDIFVIPSAKTEAVKDLFNTLLEGYAIILLMTLLLDTREKLTTAIQILVLSCGVISLIATISCIIDVNVFHFLKTVQRKMLMSNYYRLGVLRASATFGHPVYYGAFCAIIMPLNMFFYEQGKNLKEKLLFGSSMVLTLIGLILCNSRGSLIAFCFMAFLIFVHRVCCKQFKSFVLHYLPIAGALMVCLVALAFLLPNGKTLFGGIWESLVAALPKRAKPDSETTTTVGGSATPSVTTTPTEPPTTAPPATTVPPATKPSYGENASGMRSRFTQLSGIKWTLRYKPLFGFGPNAHTRGLIRYEVRPGVWWKSRTFDMGIVSVFCQHGIVGTLGYTALYGSLLFTVIRNKRLKDSLMAALFMALLSFFTCLLTISSLDCTFWLLAGFIVCLTNIMRGENAHAA